MSFTDREYPFRNSMSSKDGQSAKYAIAIEKSWYFFNKKHVFNIDMWIEFGIL